MNKERSHEITTFPKTLTKTSKIHNHHLQSLTTVNYPSTIIVAFDSLKSLFEEEKCHGKTEMITRISLANRTAYFVSSGFLGLGYTVEP